MLNKILGLICILFAGTLTAQDVSDIQKTLREMAKEKDPEKVVAKKWEAYNQFNLNAEKDAETIDMINGMIAVAYVGVGDLDLFYKYIDSISNKFNQTSMMNMAVFQLLESDEYIKEAVKLSEETILLYNSYKDDPSEKPESFDDESWKRFMDFAQYPYYDSYAHALYNAKSYDSALVYQLKSFERAPEEGLGTSVDRLVHLYILTGKESEAKDLLLKMAKSGRLSAALNSRLEYLYIKDRGSRNNYEGYLDSLQQATRIEMLTSLKNKMTKTTAPAFSLQNLKGELVSLSDYKGKTVILDLWATWCAPCIASFPAMQKLVNKHEDVEFLFIVVDEKGANALQRVKNFISKNNYNFHVLMDELVSPDSEKYVITSSYQPDGIPAKYFIDKNGDLRYKSKGFNSDNELINEVEAIIEILK